MSSSFIAAVLEFVFCGFKLNARSHVLRELIPKVRAPRLNVELWRYIMNLT